MANAFEGFEERVARAVSDLEDVLGDDNDSEAEDALKQKSVYETKKSQFKAFSDIFKEMLTERVMESNSGVDGSSSSSGGLTNFESSESSYKRFNFSTNPRDQLGNLMRLHRLQSFCDFNTTEDPESRLHQVPFPEYTDPTMSNSQLLTRPTNLNDDFLKANPEYPRSSVHRKVTNAPGILKFYRNRPFSVEMLRPKVQNLFVGSPEASGWVPTTPKCSPQVRYDQYKKFWEKYPVPGEKPRRELRWSIRNEMAKKEELQKRSWWPEVKLPPTP